jgi:heat shock protein HtpX
VFNSFYYQLQAKKVAWFGVMISAAGFTLLHTPLAPLTVLGITLGFGMYHLLQLLPPTKSALLRLVSPLLALASPIALPFNSVFLGLIAYNIMTPSKRYGALRTKRPMGLSEKEDVDLIEKLEKKTNIHISQKNVCDVDEKKFAPNASASGGFVNNSLMFFSNILKAPFNKKEKKAIIAHELGHINNMDFLSQVTSGFLFWSTCVLAFASFSLPVALLAGLTVNYAYYGISQINELLADQFAATHASPQALMAGLDKIRNIAKTVKQNDLEQETLWDKPKSFFNRFKHELGLVTHPTIDVRKSYLQSYEVEKRASTLRN